MVGIGVTELNWLLCADLLGTFVFALSGATLAVRSRFDIFGIMVLSFAAATFGGLLRDVLLGDHPPVALQSWHYIAISCVAGVAGFFWHRWIEHFRNPVRVLDAAGLALFVVVGTQKALANDITPVPAMMLGMLSGIGGGIVRDMLAAQVPFVFRSELYAVAALAGAAIVVAGSYLHLPGEWHLVVAALTVFGLRYMAIRRGWSLPSAD